MRIVMELGERVDRRAVRSGLALYLQHSNDLSESGRDRPSLLQVFKTVGSVWSSRPDKKRRARTVARVNKPASRKDGWRVGGRKPWKIKCLSESMCLKRGSMWRCGRALKASAWLTINAASPPWSSV